MIGGKTIKEITMFENMIAGASAGLCYWIGTYPLDVIKGRMMAASESERRSWFQTARQIWREDGLRAFSKGIVPCAMRAVPACAVMFTTVDFVRLHMQDISVTA